MKKEDITKELADKLELLEAINKIKRMLEQDVNQLFALKAKQNSK